MAISPVDDTRRKPHAEPSIAGAPRRTGDPGRSRVTATIRLVLAVWLMWDGVATLMSPEAIGAIAGSRGLPPEAALLLGGLSFTLGVFLLSGFMSRIAGLVLAALSAWQVATHGASAVLAVWSILGVYLMLRGGGTWAVDVYVQKMQDRVRMREEMKRRGESAAYDSSTVH